MGIFSFFKNRKENRTQTALSAPAAPEAPAVKKSVPVQSGEQKKYVFEAEKTLTERSCPGPYLFVAPAQVRVLAANEEEARQKAARKLQNTWQGTGVQLGEIKLVRCDALPVD